MDAAHYRLRRTIAQLAGWPPLAGRNKVAATQWDRPQRRRRDRLQDRQSRHADPRLYDATRHALWRDLYGARAGTFARRANRDRGAMARSSRISRTHRAQERSRTD